MNITKTACKTDAFTRPYRLYVNARTAFKSFLTAVKLAPKESVLLPAYVGWSAKEGSGVFDPVAELGLPYDFYRLDDRLHIDLDDLEHRLQKGEVRVVVLIHYFGYVDPHYAEAVAIARRYGAWVLEDEAHALLTDWVGGASGRLGDAVIFSLHKMLPMPLGGMLLVAAKHAPLLERIADAADMALLPWNYDFHEIAACRLRNAAYLAELLKPLAGDIQPLRESSSQVEIPQTFPVVVNRVSRDDLYFKLNESGFGVVSLYHTMIPQISREEFPDAHRVAKTILNLPVHQDAGPQQLAAMVQQMANLLRTMS